MFDQLRLHGAEGSIVWGYRPAAVLSAWVVAKTSTGWVLTATVARADAFQCRQSPLLFTAPRDKGVWAWGIDELTLNGNRLTARLGPPEA